MLKFEGLFECGDVIKAYDHIPVGNEHEYVIGEIIDIGWYNDYKVYTILCSEDSVWENEHSRVGKIVHVPMGVFFLEHDDRITKVN